MIFIRTDGEINGVAFFLCLFIFFILVIQIKLQENEEILTAEVELGIKSIKEG